MEQKKIWLSRDEMLEALLAVRCWVLVALVICVVAEDLLLLHR